MGKKFVLTILFAIICLTTYIHLYRSVSTVTSLTVSFVKPLKENSVGKVREKTVLTIGILSFIMRSDRREVIRNTWLRECKRKPFLVVCVFFTDPLPYDQTLKEQFLKEQEANGDMEFMDVPRKSVVVKCLI